MLLEFSLLDVDESSFLTADNRDFMNEISDEFKELYDEEEADYFDLL